MEAFTCMILFGRAFVCGFERKSTGTLKFTLSVRWLGSISTGSFRNLVEIKGQNRCDFFTGCVEQTAVIFQDNQLFAIFRCVPIAVDNRTIGDGLSFQENYA